jgi:ribose-phosphate pyrophosphokinase
VVDQLRKYPSFSAVAHRISGKGLMKIDSFADGEMEAVVNSSIRGRDVVIFSSSSRNEPGIPVDTAKMELYHTIDAVKRAQDGKIIVFEPFVSCSRSDRAARRSSVGLWVHLKILSSLGVRQFITFQLHSDKSKSMLDPCVCLIDDIPALNLMQRYLCDVVIRDKDTLENVVRKTWAVCSVDAGGEAMARQFANTFLAPLVVCHKQRDYSTVNKVESINILSAEPVDGKSLWIVDDMIDTGGSIVKVVEALYQQHPAEINIITIHPVFSGQAVARLKALTDKGMLNRILVSDTVHCGAEICDALPNLRVVSSTELSANIIRTIETNEPMSDLLAKLHVEEYLSEGLSFGE